MEFTLFLNSRKLIGPLNILTVAMLGVRSEMFMFTQRRLTFNRLKTVIWEKIEYFF